MEVTQATVINVTVKYDIMDISTKLIIKNFESDKQTLYSDKDLTEIKENYQDDVTIKKALAYIEENNLKNVVIYRTLDIRERLVQKIKEED